MKPKVVFDCETYPNFFLVSFKNLGNQKLLNIIIDGEDAVISPEDKRLLISVMAQRLTIGFNSLNFDIPVILAAIIGKTPLQITKLANKIIKNSLPQFMSLQLLGIDLPQNWETLDIIQPSPAIKTSLKVYGTRMASKKLQDLPIAPGTYLTEEEKEIIISYCENDLDTTAELYFSILKDLELREFMSKEYRMDLRSKGGAQIAEAVVKKQFKLNNHHIPKYKEGIQIKYKAPDYIQFETEQLQNLKKLVEEKEYKLDVNGYVKIKTKFPIITLGNTKYTVALGGLHSKENYLYEKRKVILSDVISYYPSIILRDELYPKNIGEKFLAFYKQLYFKRIKAKAKGNKLIADSLKLILNSTFGKFSSKWSVMFSPQTMLQITMTGQLALLMLIERLTLSGYEVISGNTDGIVLIEQKGFQEHLDWWMEKTKFELENDHYDGLFARDVNNYFIWSDKDLKMKGCFTPPNLRKNPEHPIVYKAIINKVMDDIPFRETIEDSIEIETFLSARKVNGGAVWNNEELGSVVRWYYGRKGNTIHYKTNNNKVPKTENAIPLMDLPEELPKDIDYDHYICLAEELYEKF